MTDSLIPQEFERLQTGLGFTDKIQPLYRHKADDGYHFGLIVIDDHTNTMEARFADGRPAHPCAQRFANPNQASKLWIYYRSFYRLSF